MIHSVDHAEGDRRVLVGYTPRMLNRISEGNRRFLHELGFRLPEPLTNINGQGANQEQNVGSTAEVGVGDPQESIQGEEDYKAGISPGGEGSNGNWEMLYGEMEMGHGNEDGEFLETLHEQYMSLRKLEMEARKHFDEELELAAAQGWVASTDHLVVLKEWIQELEEWIVTRDASERLCSNVEGSEAVVLKARLRKLGMDPDEIPSGDMWVPLSGLPVDDPGRESANNNKKQPKPPGPKALEALPAAPLQTTSVSHREVLENIKEWRPSTGEELESVFERHRAWQRTSKEQVDQWKSQGKVIEYLPSKALFHKKGGAGRLKTRIVACGNFAKAGGGDGDHGSTYAGGIDSTNLRIQLAHCGHMKALDGGWTAGALDIRTAFLLAPLEQSNRILVLHLPKVLINAGVVHPQELWYATGAIYGLREAPAAWSSYRDSQLPEIQIFHGEECFKLVRSKADQNLWYLKPAGDLDARPAALLGVYVDDMIATGPRAILDSLFSAIQKKWETSRPQLASDEGGILFCGLEILDSGDRSHIHQRKYILDLLSRYPDIGGGAAQPGLKEPDEVPSHDRPQPDLSRIRLAQKLAGELLRIATKTRPDLIYVTSRVGQFVTRNVEFAIQLSHNALKYLRSTTHYEIIYGKVQSGERGPDVGPLQDRAGALEAYADASFAPGNDRSQTGIILVWNQVPITWLSMRQPCASLSTAESELQSSIDALALTEGFVPLIQELENQPAKTFLYNDNQGAVTVMKIPQGNWRTRHLRLKAAWLFEQLETNKYNVYHLPGKYMLGDLCTKTLQATRIRELLAMMGMSIVDYVEGESKSGIKNLSVDSGGVPIKSGGETPSESTSRLKNLGADSVGVVAVEHELIGTSLDDREGEGATNDPRIPNSSLTQRALKLLLAAACLRRSQGKVVITIEDSEPEKSTTAWLVTLLAVLGVVLLCCGLKVGAWLRVGDGEGPRIQSMRAETQNNSDDWSVLSSAGLGERDSRDRTPSPQDREQVARAGPPNPPSNRR